MKNLIPFIALILLGSCARHTHKIGDKQMQTIQEFIGYLKKNDINGARAILPVKDTSGAERRDYYNYEMVQMDKARVALQADDIDESTWGTDTVRTRDNLYLFIMGTSKKKAENASPKSTFRFVFLIVNSDTLLDFFDYNPPPYINPEAIRKNPPMQTIHQFIGYLKNNDIQSAQAMLPLENRSGSEPDRRYHNHEIIQIANMWMALEHDDVDEPMWIHNTTMIGDKPHLFYIGTFKDSTENPDLKSVFRFAFSLSNSDTVLTYFDYNPLKSGKESVNEKEDRPMQLIHEFIGYVKSKDRKNARRMLGLSSIHIGNGSKKDSISRLWLQYAVDEIDTAAIALKQNDIDESNWKPEMRITDSTRTLLIRGHFKEKPRNRYSECPIAFGFELINSKMELDFFDIDPK